MQAFRIAHEYDASQPTFWAVFFDEGYSRAFFETAQTDFEVLRDESIEARRERVIRYRARTQVPAIMRRFLPDGLGYTEHSSFDARRRRYEHRIEPNALGSRVEIVGALCAEELAGGRLRRIYSGTVNIQVPLLGGKLEADTIASIIKAQNTADAVTREWLATWPYRASKSTAGRLREVSAS